jgi:hypothetical protein
MASLTATAHGDSSSTARSTSPIGGLRFDWQFIILSLLFVVGLFIDGWAHNHGRVDDSFFTPWHLIFYSAFGLVALFLAFTQYRNVRRGYAWSAALPPGYMLSLVGAIIFAVGGVGDLIWHTLFGIEAGSEALLSPTHIMLAAGMVLITTGPLRAAWLRRELPVNRRAKWGALFPALISATLLLALLTFITFYSNPITFPLASSAVIDTSDPAQPVEQLYIMNTDGSRQTRLLSAGDQSVSLPSWSPDGERIAYSQGDFVAFRFSEAPEDSQTDLYIMNADGTNPIQLTNAPGEEISPSWSPDGAKLVYIGSSDGTRALYTINADGTGATQMAAGDGFVDDPVWSPDGSQIAYVVDANIWVMNADGSDPARLTTGGGYASPAWSPDSARIAFAHSGADGLVIRLMDADGANVTQLTDSAFRSATPVFSADGDSIFFSSDRGGTWDLYRLSLNGGGDGAPEAVNLTRNPALYSYAPRISPDGTQILFVVRGLPLESLSDIGDTFQDYGVTAMFLSAAFLCGVILPLVRRWALPFGAITLILVVHMVFMTVLSDTFFFIPAALIAGLLLDLLMQRLTPWRTRTRGFHTFAFLLPVLYYGLYMATLALIGGVGWSIHVWTGAIVISGVIGLLISLLITVLATPASTPTETVRTT